MTKLYEVVMNDGTSEILNLSSINRIKVKEEGVAFVTVGNENLEVQIGSLMTALHNADVSVMTMEQPIPTDSV